MSQSGKHKNLWLHVIFDFASTRTLRKILWGVIALGLYTATLDYLENYVIHVEFKPPTYLFSLLGTVLGLLLVFRTNTAYDRWWSGRIYLSDMLNNNRNMASKLNAYLPLEDKPIRRRFAYLLSNHAYSMKELLRDGVKWEELDDMDEATTKRLKESYHVANEISNILNEEINKLYKKKIIDDIQQYELTKHVDIGIDIVGSCERIRTSPMPHSYNVHLKKFVFFFSLLMPFGFIHDLDYWSILIVMVIYYALAGLDAIGEEIEDPFGQDENDLPIDKICKQIRSNTRELLVVE